jgi:hypothetical protein
MGSNQSISNAPRGRRVRYIAAAPLTDVLFDQLEYLLAHRNQRCAPGCEACARLKQVESVLMLPFRTATHSLRPRRATAA